LSSSEITNLVK